MIKTRKACTPRMPSYRVGDEPDRGWPALKGVTERTPTAQTSIGVSHGRAQVFSENGQILSATVGKAAEVVEEFEFGHSQRDASSVSRSRREPDGARRFGGPCFERTRVPSLAAEAAGRSLA